MTAQEYRRRRREVINQLGSDSVLILPAAHEMIRNRDVTYPFRQDSDFIWLTGFPEPDAIAVITPGQRGAEYTLFCRPRDPERERWDGERIGIDGAVAQYQADVAYSLAELEQKIPDLLSNRRRVFYPLAVNAEFDAQIMQWLRVVRNKARGGITAPSECVSSDRILHELRLIKSPAELTLMRRAAKISALAHRTLMTTCQPGSTEAVLETAFICTCAQHGARHQAYSPIVAGGERACILHSVSNDAPLHDGDLVLIDAGAEFNGYASDITRTFPVNGRFNFAQCQLYELVLNAQAAALACAIPGQYWNAPHEAAVKVLTRGLVKLGLLAGQSKDVPRLIKEEQYKPFYMHRTGHWLGLDVHDVGDYKPNQQWRQFTPGMVLTIEPGLYIAPDADVPMEYRGIGIRIEDDVLITAGGNEILSREVPKEVAAIETLMAQRRNHKVK
ncbi:aminopeptidase P N-terminal domain-containing protein [Rhodoferax sp. 4810]|uniref:Xaa-Pro aminopeptidase n=1 Tax=Thiospirillum jenense TaxID=1653858 RepID=A0A839H8L6_9GAMM|nr:aminopeptidase P N-terminal domain-containing protein [Rhodoferax jenense]MBB1125461.1 aminopeptidase P N-terminal domain-containing protein [Thiospirillum jenense]